MSLEICGGENGACCKTGYLNNRGECDWEDRAYSIFNGTNLGDCQNFPIRNGHVPSMAVIHTNPFNNTDCNSTICESDGIQVKYWKINLSDQTKVICRDGTFHDGDVRTISECETESDTHITCVGVQIGSTGCNPYPDHC